MFPGVCWRSVIFASCPVSIHRTHTWARPLRFDTYASRFPSGDQRGDVSLYAPWVRGLSSPPPALTIHRLVYMPSFMRSFHPSV